MPPSWLLSERIAFLTLLLLAALLAVGDLWEYLSNPVFDINQQGIPGFMPLALLVFGWIYAVISKIPPVTQVAIREEALEQSFLNPANIGDRTAPGRIE